MAIFGGIPHFQTYPYHHIFLRWIQCRSHRKIFTSRPARPRKPFEHRCLRWHVRALMFGFHMVPPTTCHWLVVQKQSWKMNKFVDGKDDIPYIVENKICSKPPTTCHRLSKGYLSAHSFRFWLSQWIGLREHLQEIMDFQIWNIGVNLCIPVTIYSVILVLRMLMPIGYGYGMYGGFLKWGYPCSSSISIVL